MKIADHKFPHWVYAELSWANVRQVVNEDALFDAINTVRYNMGRFTPAIRDDGYWVFPSYHGAYDPEAALHRIYGSGPRKPQPTGFTTGIRAGQRAARLGISLAGPARKGFGATCHLDLAHVGLVASSMPGVLVHPNSGAAKSCARSQEDQCVAKK